MFLTFPSYNIYSVTLLILVLQGYVFSFLLFRRFYQHRRLSDICLGVLLFIQGHHCTAFIIGFMDWYDTFRNTKINYLLFDFSLLVGPLLYFYIKGLTKPSFKFRKIDWLHFLPGILYTLYGVFVWMYDSQTAIYETVQNGPWEENINFKYVYPVMEVIQNISLLTYLILTVLSFVQYRKKIVAFFSNTYKVELNWIALFMGIYVSLFFFQLGITLVDQYITELTWTDFWWRFFAIALTVYFIGMKGYYTDLTKLHDFSVEDFDNLNLETSVEEKSTEPQLSNEQVLELALIRQTKPQLIKIMETTSPYLNPDLTLSELSKTLNITPNFLSKVINSGFGKNFNEFINEYRVETVKNKIIEGNTHLSLLGIAYECGFNSKATFNRTFKKFTGYTPSQFSKTIQKAEKK